MNEPKTARLTAAILWSGLALCATASTADDDGSDFWRPLETRFAAPGAFQGERSVALPPPSGSEDSVPSDWDNDQLFPQDAVTEPPVLLAVRAHAWLSRGRSEMILSGTNGPPYCHTTQWIDVLSELQWKNVDSTVSQLSAELSIRRHVVILGTLGFGSPRSGTFDDYDYCAPGRNQLVSHTFHPLQGGQGGDIRNFSLDVGYRWLPSDRCSLVLLLGHQRHSERYVAVDGVDLFPGSRTERFQGETVITQKYVWSGLRVGARVAVDLLPRLTLEADGFYLPANKLRLTDIHHLRDDLRQDPSILAQADGGWGAAGRAMLICHLGRGLSLELGYQVLHNQSDTGESTARTYDGDAINPFQATTFRHGLLLGGRYEF